MFSQEMYTDWMNRKAKVDKEVKELMKISQYLSGVEVPTMNLSSNIRGLILAVLSIESV